MGGNWRLVTYLAVQGTVAAVSFWLPDPAGGLVRLSVAGAGIVVLAGAVVGRRPRRRVGWWLVVLSGSLTFGEAVAIAALYGLGPGERVASVPQLGLGIWGLLALAAGLAVLGWRGTGSWGWDALDTSVIAIGVFLLVWGFYLDPMLAARPSAFATVVAIAVPSASLLVFAMAVKLAFGGAVTTWSGRMLLLATAAGLCTAAFFIEPVGARTIEIDLPLLAAALAQMILLGAVGMAADFTGIVARGRRAAGELPSWRVVLFLLLALLAPLVVAVDFARVGTSGPTAAALMVPLVCSMLILGILVIRLVLVARVAQRRAQELDDRSASLARAMDEQDELQRQLAYRALHDPLTGLANRHVLTDRMEWLRDTSAGRRDSSDRGHALMMLDLDGFKDVNDSFGHPVGDQLLVNVAQRLVSSVPHEAVVVRLGGDEFAVLLESTRGDDARRVAEAILEALKIPYFVAGREVFLSASIGLLITEPNERPPGSSEGLRDVDQALYAAKAAGRNRVAEFDPRLLVQRLQQARTSTGLRHAVARDELLLHYQPIVALDDSQVVGVEALMRWQPKGHEMVSPGEFIPVAEQIGLIIEIGTWALRRACRDVAPWHARYGINVGVNVSGRQLDDSGFADIVFDALEEAGLPGSALVLELTESSLIATTTDQAVRAQLDRLRERGVQIAIDDFGTGYSSLSYISRLPVDLVKIDSSFTPSRADSTVPHQTWPFVRAILQLISSLGLSAIAEGIETREQAEALRKLGCPYAQGYLFSPPGPADRIEGILQLGTVRQRS